MDLLHQMPLNKPITDSVISYWKNVFDNFRSKSIDLKKYN